MNNRLALVIGNAAYQHINRLRNTLNDAKEMKVKLEQLGFDVMLGLDATNATMEALVVEFARRMADYSVGLFYFSGHGAQSLGENILCPVDMPVLSGNSEQIYSTLLNGGLLLNEVLARIQKYEKQKVLICIVDACRSDPLLPPPAKGLAEGETLDLRLVPPKTQPRGTIISFATSPMQVSYDGIPGRRHNGAYTGVLLEWIDKPDMKIEDMFKAVRYEVDRHTGGSQLTWDHSSLIGDFYFNPQECRSLEQLTDQERSAAYGLGLPRLRTSCPNCLHEIVLEEGQKERRCPFCRRIVDRP